MQNGRAAEAESSPGQRKQGQDCRDDPRQSDGFIGFIVIIVMFHGVSGQDVKGCEAIRGFKGAPTVSHDDQCLAEPPLKAPRMLQLMQYFLGMS